MSRWRKRTKALAVLASFLALVAVIVGLARHGVVPPETALLMVVALFGFYLGIGIMVAVYRLVERLD